MELRFLPETMDWRCHRCDCLLEAGSVELEYLGSVFNVELPVCRHCQTVLITEDLACGRMLEVEKLLEDK